MRIEGGSHHAHHLHAHDAQGPIPFARFLEQVNREQAHRADLDRVDLISAPRPADNPEHARLETDRPRTNLTLKPIEPPPVVAKIYAIEWLPRTGKLIDLII